jgi:hypothetical protein
MDLFRKECLKLQPHAHVPVGELTGVVNADIELIKVATTAMSETNTTSAQGLS